MKPCVPLIATCLIALVAVPAALVAQPATPVTSAQAGTLSPELRQKLMDSQGRAAAFLQQQQRADGTFDDNIGISALAATALLRMPGASHDKQLALTTKQLDALVALQKPDGGIYDKTVPHYVTAVAVMALVAGGRPADKPVIEKARQYLADQLLDEGEGSQADRQVRYGGMGYGAPSPNGRQRGHHQPRVRAPRDEGIGPAGQQPRVGQGDQVPAAHAEQQRDQRSEMGGQRRRLRVLPRLHLQRRRRHQVVRERHATPASSATPGPT